MTYSFEVNTRSQSLGIFGLSEIGISTLEISKIFNKKGYSHDEGFVMEDIVILF